MKKLLHSVDNARLVSMLPSWAVHVIAVILILFKAGSVFAQAQSVPVIVAKSVKVFVDGKPIPADICGAIGAPYSPRIINGHLMIPLRFFNHVLHEGFIYDSDWDIVQVGDAVRFRADDVEAHSTTISRSGPVAESIMLSIAPRRIHGLLYLPLVDTLSFVGRRLTWDPETSTIHIYTIDTELATVANGAIGTQDSKNQDSKNVALPRLWAGLCVVAIASLAFVCGFFTRTILERRMTR